jgi:hypothetical protein
MTSDEDLISTCSAGHRNMLLEIALVKRLLTMPGITVNEQLRLLQQIAGCVCHEISAAMIEVIEPASDVEIRMIDTAMSLDGEQPRAPSFYVLAKSFRQFCAVNSSYIAALRLGAPKGGNVEIPVLAAEIDPIGSPPMRSREAPATSVPPKSDLSKLPKPAAPPEKYQRLGYGSAPWDDADTFY